MSTLLADQLLLSDNLDGTKAFVHETSAKSKALQAAWKSATDLAAKVTHHLSCLYISPCVLMHRECSSQRSVLKPMSPSLFGFHHRSITTV